MKPLLLSISRFFYVSSRLKKLQEKKMTSSMYKLDPIYYKEAVGFFY